MAAHQALLGYLCWSAVLTLPSIATLSAVRDKAEQLDYEPQDVSGIIENETWWKSQFEALIEKEGGRPGEHDEVSIPTKQLGKGHVIGTRNLLKALGYPGEAYTARTDDGYLLSLFRVPRPGAPIVFLMHGLLVSSADWVVTGADDSLGVLLYNAGFDVWMGNARGTTESRRHETLDPSDPAFWDFSWHEIGTLDLPASIDFILDATGQDALHYVGHSQGTTTFFVMGSERPEYMAKIKTFSALAPIAYVRDIRSVPLRMLAVAPNTLALLIRLLGVNELLPRSDLIEWLGDHFCADSDVTQPLCGNFVFIICGFDSQELNWTALPDILANTPAGASVKQVLHFGQNMRSLRLSFRKFSYGWLENLKRYGSVLAPEYDLSKVTAPTYLFYSDNDLLSVQSNVDKLMRTLPNIAPDGMRRIPLPAFNHFDFIFAKHIKSLIADELISVITAHERSKATEADDKNKKI